MYHFEEIRTSYHHVASVEKDIEFMKKISATSMIMLKNCE